MSEPRKIDATDLDRWKKVLVPDGFTPVDQIPGPAPDDRAERWRAIVPPRFADATLDDLAADVRELVEAWRPSVNLLLLGGTGTGKTHAAAAIARHRFVELHESVKFAPVVELLDQLRDFDNETAYDEAAGCDLLVLDDLGAEKATEWAGERLYAIVNYRWSQQLPIIVTSNLSTREALTEAVGERIMSRLGDGAVGVGIGGKDRRR